MDPLGHREKQTLNGKKSEIQKENEIQTSLGIRMKTRMGNGGRRIRWEYKKGCVWGAGKKRGGKGGSR